MTRLLLLLSICSVFGSHIGTWRGGCNRTARAYTGKNFLKPGANLGCTGSDADTGLSLTSPSIAVEHGHVYVCGASVSQQVVI